MCVAELNVSTLPCRHRWYHLLRPCTAGTNLANCPNKLGLEGWETKCSFCPFCSSWSLSTTDYRLVGNDRSPSIGGLSRSPSLSLTTARRDSRAASRAASRRGSLARTDSSSSISGMVFAGHVAEKNKAISSRLDAYLGVHPERKGSRSGSEASDEDDQPSSPYETDMNKVDAQTQGRRDSTLSKGWKKSKRFSRGLFK
ncbi:uncharacterized protein K452DRAFT_303597 [Aplosporella prunicola CBS 121167]|uniref:Uncharacterized protein n=1 Tax=Aplosporella prunicola CBS 121167 TaxID=1176127 RepID=A0A6A6AWJ8_9PEZI|nr:uncharacterized protein K452DRAFT_303597 [Aplosporella prunicola CBS 121167]KAF2135355.1 hypothetical protein K452DRAFT_303597 [Aplosporella prunicola CBS 121167]